MKKRSFANRLSLRIMAVLIVVSTIIMIAVYLITKDSMAHEAEMRASSSIPMRRSAACSPMSMWLPSTMWT